MGDPGYCRQLVAGVDWVGRILPTHFGTVATALHVLLRPPRYHALEPQREHRALVGVDVAAGELVEDHPLLRRLQVGEVVLHRLVVQPELLGYPHAVVTVTMLHHPIRLKCR